MAVPREMHEHYHQTLEYLSPGPCSLKVDVIMYPMNSCERCEKQRKGVNGNSAKQGCYSISTWKTDTQLRDAMP